MSFRSRQVRDAVDALGLEHFDDAVSDAFLELGDPPFTTAQVRGALKSAKLPPSCIIDVMDFLDEENPEKQAQLAAKVKAKAALKALKDSSGAVGDASESESSPSELAAGGGGTSMTTYGDVFPVVRPPAAVLATSSRSNNGIVLQTTIPLASMQLGKRLGSGSFGVVYKAEWRGEEVAVKVSNQSTEGDSSLEKELDVIFALPPHKNVLRLCGVCLDCGIAGGPGLGLVLEFCGAGTVHSYLEKLKKPLSLDLVLSIALQSARGLQHLHAHRVNHRDFRAVNVLLKSTEPVCVKVTDFGLAHLRSNDRASGGSLTLTTIGPIPWMAPEVLVVNSVGKLAVTNPSDVYMFGCFLIEVLTGNQPWFWFSGDLQAYRIANEGADPVTEALKVGQWTTVVQKALDSDHASANVSMLERLVSLCLNVDPAARPTMEQVVDTLAYMAASRGETVATERMLIDVIYATTTDFVPSGFTSLRQAIRIQTANGNSGLAISPDGTVMTVSNVNTHRIVVYGLPSGAVRAGFGSRGSGSGQFHRPEKLCFSPRNSSNMFIADWGNKRVQEMSLGGEYVRTIGDGVITGNPFGIAASVDTVLVGVDGGTHGIMMFDLTSGTLLRSFGEEGESEGKLLRVRGLRLTLEHVFVAEAGTDRLSVFSLSGDFVRCISLATACGPSDVDITPGGNVLVVCTVSNCVCEYSLDGPSLLRSFGSYGDEPLECKLPVAIATHGDYAFVLEYASARVQIFNPLAS